MWRISIRYVIIKNKEKNKKWNICLSFFTMKMHVFSQILSKYYTKIVKTHTRSQQK